jgi:hypothetical protein
VGGSKPSPSVHARRVYDIGSMQVNETKPKVDAGTPQRRRVLRGVIAAPVVMTISSGAGAQMTSNLRCVANQVNNPTTLPRSYGAGSGVPATVIRVQLHYTGGKRYVAGSDLLALQHPSRPISWIGVGQYREFDSSTNTLAPPPNVTFNTVPPRSAHYAVVQLDQHGYIVSVGKATGTTSMVGATCWNSFRAGP